MYCTSCGKVIAEKSSFCSTCGQPSLPSRATSQPAPAAQDFFGAQQVAPPPAGPSSFRTYFEQVPDYPGPLNSANSRLANIQHGFAWGLVAAPLVAAILRVSLGSVMLADIATLLAGAINLAGVLVLIQLDQRQLRDAGIRISRWLAYFILPVYLYQRSKRTGMNHWPVIGWALSVVLAFGVYAFGANYVGSQVSTDATETAIQDWLAQKGYSDASVQCPSFVLSKPDARFDCVADGAVLDGTIVSVTIQNTAGDVIWQVEQLP